MTKQSGNDTLQRLNASVDICGPQAENSDRKAFKETLFHKPKKFLQGLRVLTKEIACHTIIIKIEIITYYFFKLAGIIDQEAVTVLPDLVHAHWHSSHTISAWH